MINKILISLMTSERGFFTDREISSMLVQTRSGETQILPGHTHVFELLADGILTIDLEDRSKEYFFVRGGLIRAISEKVVVMADVVENVCDIDTERVRKSIEKSQDLLKMSDLSDREYLKYQAKIKRAEMRLKASLLAHK